MDNQITPSDSANTSEVISKTKALAIAGTTAVADIGGRMRSLANLKSDAALKKSPEMIEEIVVRLMHGESLLSICTDPRMPDPSTVGEWQRSDAELREQISWARGEGMHVLFDAQLDIAAGGYFSTGDTERDALLIKAINNVAAKRNRGNFGDKVEIKSNAIHYTVTKDAADW